MMKSRNRLVVLSIVLILVTAVSMMSYMGDLTANAKPSFSFTLKAVGSAYDPNHNTWVNIELTLTGSATGKLKVEIDLYIKGSDVYVENYGTFDISRGCGEVVNVCHYVALYFTLTSKYYGGKGALWCLSGRTWKLTGQILSVTLYSEYIMLPTSSGTRVLKYLTLTGTLTA